MTTAPILWRLSKARTIALGRPRIMAILNLTPDSFSDGGAYAGVDDAVRAAAGFVEAGAEIIDVGGESTRPGAAPVDAAEQIRRTVPVIAEMRRTLGDGVAMTIDTTSATVAGAALDAGADAVNDVSAGLDDPGMFALVEARSCGVVLMHRLRRPAGDAYSTAYTRSPDYGAAGGVVAAVRAFLSERLEAAAAAGVRPESIVLDPGLGFGKSVDDNLRLIRETGELAALGRPVLSGLSRKSFVARAAGMPDGGPTAARVDASVGLSVAHLFAGASIFRVHDVAEHRAALWAAHVLREPRP